MNKEKLLKIVLHNCAKSHVSTNIRSQINQKKLEHYRKLYEKELATADNKPSGWEEAKPFESIPGPKPLPIIGNVWRFMLPKIGDFHGLDFFDITKQLYKKYGEIVMLKGSLGGSLLLLFKANDFEKMIRNEGVWPIRKNFPSLDYYRKVNEGIVPNFGLVSHHGEPWYIIRSTVNPILLKPGNAQQYTAEMDTVAEQLIDNIKFLSEKNENGEMPNDFINELYKWGLESIGVVTLDTKLGCLKRDLEPNSEVSRLIYSVITIPELMYKLDLLPSTWKYINTPDWKTFTSLLNVVLEVTEKHINEALDKLETEGKQSSDIEPQSVLKQLIKEDRKIAISMAMDMILAGIDSTGKILGAGLYFLGKNPQRQEELRKEAMKLLPTKNTPVTNEILNKAIYLRGVIKETMRLAPTAVGTLRTTGRNLILSGYQIPRGTDVLACNLMLCTMEEHFIRPHEFLPERWIPSNTEITYQKPNPVIYAPFGRGARSCVGMRFANLELQIAFLKIIRNFEISWPHEDMEFKTTTLYGIAKPLKIRVKSIDN